MSFFFFFITSVYVQNRSPILTQCNHLFFCSCAKTYHSNKRTFSCFVFICRATAETGDIVTMNFGFQEMAILNINFASAYTDTYILWQLLHWTLDGCVQIHWKCIPSRCFCAFVPAQDYVCVCVSTFFIAMNLDWKRENQHFPDNEKMTNTPSNFKKKKGWIKLFGSPKVKCSL